MNSMDSLDLNIHNYDLNDLINLFNIPFAFTEEDLKNAKKTVLKTHPDKSKLDKKFFLFFSKAYKYLFKIYQLRKSSTTTNTEYQQDDHWDNEQNILIDGAIKTMDQTQYNKWFNDTFEKMKLSDNVEETGYGDWLKSNDDMVDRKITNMAEMNEYMQNKKSELRAVVLHKEFQEINSNSHFDLIRDTPANFGSDMFDKLQFEDLKSAHGESLIPVTDEDFHNRKKYSNIDEMNRDRTNDIITAETKWLPNQEAKLKNMHSDEEDINIRRAYKLMNQDEQIRDNYNKFWSDLKRIDN